MSFRKNAWAPLVACLVASAPAAAALFDHSAYDTILQHYVDADGYVDYAGIRDNTLSALDSYVGQLGDADLAGWPRNERIAFWINAYNARTIQLVAEHPKMRKISENLDMFNEPFKVAGRRLSLNDILYRILRARVNPDNKRGPIENLTIEKPDVRVLFALVSGAIGSPRLRNTAYTAENLDRSLREATSQFVNDPQKIDVRDGHLVLSSIFKWFKRDFATAGGVPAYVAPLLKSDLRMDAETLQMQLTTLYSKAVYVYDWTVNDVKNKEGTSQAPAKMSTESDDHSEPSSAAPDTGDSEDATAAPSPSVPNAGPSGPTAPVHPSAEDLGNP